MLIDVSVPKNMFYEIYNVKIRTPLEPEDYESLTDEEQ